MNKTMPRFGLIGLVAALVLALSACSNADAEGWHTMTVTASAYTLSPSETDDGPTGLAAWGDVLKPGMKAVAVSRDLIKKGLGHGAKVKIEGLDGVYTVRDKMNKRWEKKIDILFEKRKKALEWGKKTVTIHWKPAEKAK